MDEFCRNEHREYMRHIVSASRKKRIGFQHYHEYIGYAEDLWALRDKLEGFGLLGYLLGCFVELAAEISVNLTKADLEIALWDARMEQFYAEVRWARNAAKVDQYKKFAEAYQKEQGSAGERIRRLIEGSCPLPKQERTASKHTGKDRKAKENKASVAEKQVSV